MKALTLIQPWAWAIAHAGKRTENRSWAPPASIIGHQIAIHAGKKYDGLAAKEIIYSRLGTPPSKSVCARGAVVAVATVVGWRHPGHGGVGGSGITIEDDPWWGGPDCVAWLLDGVRALRHPVPCAGQLGLWQLPAAVEAEVLQQIRDPVKRH